MYTEELQEVKLNSYNIIFSSHVQLLDKQYMEVLNGAKNKTCTWMVLNLGGQYYQEKLKRLVDCIKKNAEGSAYQTFKSETVYSLCTGAIFACQATSKHEL